MRLFTQKVLVIIHKNEAVFLKPNFNCQLLDVRGVVQIPMLKMTPFLLLTRGRDAEEERNNIPL